MGDKSNEQPGQFRGGYKVGHGGDKLSTLEQTAINSQRRFETLRGKGYGGLMTSGAVDVQTDRQFAKGTTDALDNAFREETIGLVTKEKFVETRRTIAERLEEEKRKKEREAEEQAERERQKKREERARSMAQRTKLSFFAPDDDAAEDADEGTGAETSTGPSRADSRAEAPKEPTDGKAGDASAEAQGVKGGSGAGGGKTMSLGERLKLAQQALRRTEESASGSDADRPSGENPRKRVKKNPDVRTDFLPDREREQEEYRMKKELQDKWKAEQDAIRNQPMEMRYSYWDGTGHGYTLVVRKGDTIGKFLQAAKEQLGQNFRELQLSSSSSLMYVKDDFIIPHDVTFYDLIMKRISVAGGKHMSLFRFHDEEFQKVGPDGRQRVDKNDNASKLYLAKVVDRSWYSRNKHAPPANRWEPYDPTMEYEEQHLWRREGKFIK